MAGTGTTAILLAGGRGSRMNYQDKAWVIFAGRPMLTHVIDHIKADVDQILISRNSTNTAYDDLPYEAIADEMPGYQGPLAGLTSCSRYVKNTQVLVLPCDVPVLPIDLVSRLSTRLSGDSLVVAASGGRIQPLIFMTRAPALDSIASYLETGRRSVMGWLETREITEEDFGPGEFVNVNEPSQLS